MLYMFFEILTAMRSTFQKPRLENAVYASVLTSYIAEDLIQRIEQ
ncbi:hypothetical protein IFVP182_C290659 [Vibrio parahaemolyticus]